MTGAFCFENLLLIREMFRKTIQIVDYLSKKACNYSEKTGMDIPRNLGWNIFDHAHLLEASFLEE